MNRTGPGRHPLDAAEGRLRDITEVVLMTKHAGQHNRDNLHITVRVGAEAFSRSDRIIVTDAHRPKGRVVGIIEIPEGEDMTALQPAVIELVRRRSRVDFNQWNRLLCIL